MSVFAKNTAGKSSLNPHNKGNERESFFGVQAKLNIGKSNDKYEVEADKVADTVISNKKNIAPDPFFAAPPAIQNKVATESHSENKNDGIQKKTVSEGIFPVLQPKLKVVHNKHASTPETFFNASPVIQNKRDNEIQKKNSPEKEVQKETTVQKITPVIQLKVEKEESVQNKIESPKTKEKTPTSKSLVQPKKEEEIQKKNAVEKVDIAQNKTDTVKTESPKTKEKILSLKPLIQKKKEEEIQAKEEEEIQAKEDEKELQMSASADTNPPDASNLESTLNSSKSGGSPLSGKVKTEMESGIGADFSNVHIHNDSTAVQLNQQLGAQAFATGNNIYFNEGKYNPNSQDGKHLLAHELTHTVQQGASKPLVQKMEQSNLQIQKEAPDVSAVRIDVNRVGDVRFNDVLNNFNNAISLFQNWYFDKDEADETFYNEASQIIRNASSLVSDASTPIGGRLAGAFGYAALQLGLNRFEFITSLTLVNGGFNQMINEHFIGRAATILETDAILWGTIVDKYSNHEPWLDQATQAGLPPASNSNLQQQLLSRLIFAYRRWELHQHSAMYQGIYSMGDPNLDQMQAGADAAAADLIAHPRMNLGDVIFSLPDYTLLERMTMDPIAQTYTIGQTGFSVPIFEGLGVGLRGALTAGYNIGGYFGGINITNLQFGFSYAQTPVMFDALALALPLGGLNALKAISLLYNSRFRLTGILEIPAEIYAQMFIEAALGIGLEVGLTNIISADVAGIDGSLRAEGNARFGAFFGAPVDIIIAGGQMSFSHAASLELRSSLGFDILGSIHAHFLTLDWERSWNIASWRWDRDWMLNSNMNLIYINGIQGDPKNVINVQNFIHAVSQLNNLGSQIMNLGPTGTSSGPSAGPPPMPNPRGHLNLKWPKPPSANYPPLYLTHRGETRSQRALRDLHDAGDSTIEEFRPHVKNFLPANEAEIGIDPEYQIASGTSVGPLDENASTPGGDKMNRLVRHYGINPSQQQGDHVYEIQVGGPDDIVNMWPLDAHINTTGGSRLNTARVTEASTGNVFRIDFLKTAMRNYGHVTYMFIITDFD